MSTDHNNNIWHVIVAAGSPSEALQEARGKGGGGGHLPVVPIIRHGQLGANEQDFPIQQEDTAIEADAPAIHMRNGEKQIVKREGVRGELEGGGGGGAEGKQMPGEKSCLVIQLHRRRILHVLASQQLMSGITQESSETFDRHASTKT